MHDPMVVAFEVKLPIPSRAKWAERRFDGRRWGWSRRRWTDTKELMPWWRARSWRFALAGRVYQSRTVVTVWHVEPDGHDSGQVCKHYERRQDDAGKWHTKWKHGWRWHIHHWHIQVHVLQSLRTRLFDRCELCGRKGSPNFSHSWDGDRLGWWKFRSRRGLYHYHCSGYVSMEHRSKTDEAIIRHLVAALRLERDETEEQVLAFLCDAETRGFEFKHAYRLWTMLGYERAGGYKLVRKPERATR